MDAPLSGLRKIGFACFAMLLGFGILELAARGVELYRPAMDVDYGLGFSPGSRVYEPAVDDASWRVTAPAKRNFFVEERFQAQKPAGLLRIAAVGGSSVRYADDELQILRRNVEQALGDEVRGVELINAGGLGYGSHRVVPVVAELLGYDLDLLLVYSGHNEFEEVEQLALRAPATTAVQERLARSSAFFRLLRDALTSLQVEALEREHNEKVLSHFPAQARAWNHPFSRDDVEERMAAYERNIRLIVEMADRAGVPVVIGSVPSNLYRPTLPPEVRADFLPIFARYQTGDWEAAHEQARVFLAKTLGRHQSSATENEILRRVAADSGTPLADVEARVLAAEPHGVPGEVLFRDHCHLNRRGNRLWRLSYEPIVLDLLSVRTDSAP